jgi:AmpD protein
VFVDAHTGCLRDVRYCASPNCDERPPGATVDLIVVHGISLPPGKFGGPWIERLFTNRLDSTAHSYFREIEGLRVSAHALITRSGDVLQFVPFHRRAWHAGQSIFQGRERCNDYSIGIELEGADEIPYEPTQYAVLASVIGALWKAFPALPRENVVGHSDIAPGRKTDPGPAFDWIQLWRLLKAIPSAHLLR